MTNPLKEFFYREFNGCSLLPKPLQLHPEIMIVREQICNYSVNQWLNQRVDIHLLLFDCLQTMSIANGPRLFGPGIVAVESSNHIKCIWKPENILINQLICKGPIHKKNDFRNYFNSVNLGLPKLPPRKSIVFIVGGYHSSQHSSCLDSSISNIRQIVDNFNQISKIAKMPVVYLGTPNIQDCSEITDIDQTLFSNTMSLMWRVMYGDLREEKHHNPINSKIHYFDLMTFYNPFIVSEHDYTNFIFEDLFPHFISFVISRLY